MTRATLCWFALGLSVSMAAACGDDDSVSANGGGGGRAGSAGRGGAATGGASGRGGAGGMGGTSVAGTGGASVGGTGGAAAGTGGAAAGTGGSGGSGGVVEPPDAGPDGGELLPDGGVSCPADLAAIAEGIDGADGQNVIISRIVFHDGGADVTFRGVNGGGHDFGDPQVLCGGSEDEDCDDNVQDLDEPDDGGANNLAEGEEVTMFTGDLDPAGGELALVNGLPSVDDTAIIFAYIAWGTFESVGFDDGASLDDRAAEVGIWSSGDRVENGPNTTIYVLGDADATAFEAGFAACTQN